MNKSDNKDKMLNAKINFSQSDIEGFMNIEITRRDAYQSGEIHTYPVSVFIIRRGKGHDHMSYRIAQQPKSNLLHVIKFRINSPY